MQNSSKLEATIAPAGVGCIGDAADVSASAAATARLAGSDPAAKLAGAGLSFPLTPELEHARPLSSAVAAAEAASPCGTASLDSGSSGGPTSRGASDVGAGSGSGSRSGGRPAACASAGRASPVLSVGDLGEQPPLEVDLDFLCERLKQGPLTGQVVAWGWDQAARLCQVRRTMPHQLFSSLWAATEACVFRMTAQDVVEILESWLAITRQCARHFRLGSTAVHTLATYALPAAVKRMDERQLARVACMARDLALHRNESDLSASIYRGSSGGGGGPPASPKKRPGLQASQQQQRQAGAGLAGLSPRDLLQPVFSLVAAEAAWRAHNAARYVSPAAIDAILDAGRAWKWRVLPRDSQSLASLKEGTAAALALLQVAADVHAAAAAAAEAR